MDDLDPTQRWTLVGLLATLLALTACGIAAGESDSSPGTQAILAAQADLERRQALDATIAKACRGKVAARVSCAQRMRENL